MDDNTKNKLKVQSGFIVGGVCGTSLASFVMGNVVASVGAVVGAAVAAVPIVACAGIGYGVVKLYQILKKDKL